jgi:hypothetical protein
MRKFFEQILTSESQIAIATSLLPPGRGGQVRAECPRAPHGRVQRLKAICITTS